jgi:DNA-binding NarL/FixJ family response regulator
MEEQQQISLLIVDDDLHFRQGLRTLLGFYSMEPKNGLKIEVVGEASNVDLALKLVVSQQPDTILLDMELAGSDGITALIALREMSYPGKILVLSGHQEENWIFRAMQAGASGYVFKSRVAMQLWEAINTIRRSEIFLPIEVVSKFFHRFQSEAAASLRTCQQFHLTEREREVLHWLTEGASNEEIAKHLYVTVATVKAHLTSIFTKLKVTSRAQAIVAAVKLGLVYT